MAPSRPFRVAMVGCGGIAGVHVRAILDHPEALKLAGCADVSLDKAHELSARCGGDAPAFDDYVEMIRQVGPDIVIVATWPNLHEEQVTTAALLGVPMILCEKSLAMSAAAAMRMAEAARRAGCVLVEGFMGRHHPRTLELERLVRDGRIGPLRKIRAGFQRPALVRHSWKQNPAFGGVVFDFACYCVNAIGQFTTQLPDRVYAATKRQNDGLIVQLDGMLQYADGLIAFVESSYTFAFQQPLELHGETGILRMHNAWTGTGASGIDLEPNRNPTVIENLPTPTADRAACQLLHLCDCLATGVAPRFTIEESIRNHEVIDAMLASAASGEVVTLATQETS